MSLIRRDSLIIYFGDKSYEISLIEINESRFSSTLVTLIASMGLSFVIALEQIHGIGGVIISDVQDSWFEHTADFAITDQKNCGLVIFTGDCVPLILYDPIRPAIGAVHIGWKGSLTGIVNHAVSCMQKTYGSELNTLQVFFGPSARACCYEVQQNFIDMFAQYSTFKKHLFQRDGLWYFDNSDFLKEQLLILGILLQNIYTSNALCTICNLRYCSFRRDKDRSGRQVTVVALR